MTTRYDNAFRGGGRKPSVDTARERFVKHLLEWLRDGGSPIPVDFRIQKPYTIKDVVEAYLAYEEEVTERVIKKGDSRRYEARIIGESSIDSIHRSGSVREGD